MDMMMEATGMIVVMRIIIVARMGMVNHHDEHTMQVIIEMRTSSVEGHQKRRSSRRG